MQNDNDNILIPDEQEPDEQVDTRVVEWEWENVDENQINVEEFPFSDLEGLKVRMKNNPSLDFVDLYLNNEIIELLVRETHQYADQFLEDKPVTKTYLRQWTGVTVNEAVYCCVTTDGDCVQATNSCRHRSLEKS